MAYLNLSTIIRHNAMQCKTRTLTAKSRGYNQKTLIKSSNNSRLLFLNVISQDLQYKSNQNGLTRKPQFKYDMATLYTNLYWDRVWTAPGLSCRILDTMLTTSTVPVLSMLFMPVSIAITTPVRPTPALSQYPYALTSPTLSM